MKTPDTTKAVSSAPTTGHYSATTTQVNTEVPDQPASFSNMTLAELLKRLGAIQAAAYRNMATMTGAAYTQAAQTHAYAVLAVQTIQSVIDGGL
ncbi:MULTISPECIES: hypothetical protein [Giesbergeria]|uniref:Killing trait domain-containing protein n=1 Tax=Giesbergeria sinuosa TaxID=80883 RepID=A0ABV9QET5_9BURK